MENTKKFEVENHEPSLVPSGKEWKLVWGDEFDGPELDRTKWDFRLNFWGKKFDGYTDQGIKFDGNSCIELHRTERNGYYVSPQLQTGSNSFDVPYSEYISPYGKEMWSWPLGELSEAKFVHRFGYYECRCKFQKFPEEMWSAFWTQSPSIGTSYDAAWCGVETDIMECFSTGKASCINHMGGYAAQHKSTALKKYDFEPSEDGFHRFGMYWSPKEYIFYFDGNEISRDNTVVSQVPQFILLTTEVQGWRKEKPLKVEGEFVDDAFVVDYVRVFDEV